MVAMSLNRHHLASLCLLGSEAVFFLALLPRSLGLSRERHSACPGHGGAVPGFATGLPPLGLCFFVVLHLGATVT